MSRGKRHWDADQGKSGPPGKKLQSKETLPVRVIPERAKDLSLQTPCWLIHNTWAALGGAQLRAGIWLHAAEAEPKGTGSCRLPAHHPLPSWTASPSSQRLWERIFMSTPVQAGEHGKMLGNNRLPNRTLSNHRPHTSFTE